VKAGAWVRRHAFRPRGGTQVVITGESSSRPGSGFSYRHPLLAYVFGDMTRAFFVVGCLVLDLFAPLQAHASAPGQDLWLLPPLFIGLGVLSYAEYRVYRWLWPGSRRREVIDLVEGRGP
jgi:hypothetical protein